MMRRVTWEGRACPSIFFLLPIPASATRQLRRTTRIRPDLPYSNGIDGSLKTPYSIAMDLSVQRQLQGGFTFEAAYVGRRGRHLLQQLDLAAATDLVDPKSGMDYFTAATLMTQFALAHGEDKTAVIPPIPYFEDVFPTAAAGGFSATQNIYTGAGGNAACPSGFRWANRPGREIGAPFRLGLLATQL